MTTTVRPAKQLDRSIVEGPLSRAVWMLAWPTVLQNLIGGLQGVVDHALVGHLVGYAGNAAIGVAIQIFIVVIAFIMSVFSGMGVLVARFAGANEPEKVWLNFDAPPNGNLELRVHYEGKGALELGRVDVRPGQDVTGGAGGCALGRGASDARPRYRRRRCRSCESCSSAASGCCCSSW